VLGGGGGSEPVYLNFYKDRKNIFSRGKTGFSNNNYLNNFNVSVSALVGDTSLQELDHISITSNGLDNEGEKLILLRLIQYSIKILIFHFA
jgi:hypothetical protein